ncbi:MAG: SDR family NAD(P)-dependent oxidoreductase [Saprospiraceae bacterium]|nr:SDR family NAD(P)-dependent oxidoreductase [Saprospiraceae bacterium]
MKTILITGVSTGIGYDAFAKLYALGYHVIGTVRKREDAERLRSIFKENATILEFDVRDIDKCRIAIESVFPLLSEDGLTCLINNAGVAMPGPLQHLSEEDFENQLDVNVKSVRRITNLLLPYLGVDKRFQPGRMINISSVSGLFNAPFNGAYCISKHALESMTDIYRRELAMFGIKVVAIEPGPIKTAIWKKSLGSLDKYKDTEYGEILSAADKMIANAEKSALPVEDITTLIIKIIQSKDPATRYLVHSKKLMFKLLSQYLPDKLVDRLVAKTMASGDNYRPV